MIVGTGIDIVEVERFGKAVEKWGDNFLCKIFTQNEISYSKKRRFSNQHFAARFATKEAVFKAFGDGNVSIRKWTDIEILNDEGGKPVVVFHGSAEELRDVKKVNDIKVSMSHSHAHAVANAILIADKEEEVKL